MTAEKKPKIPRKKPTEEQFAKPFSLTAKGKIISFTETPDLTASEQQQILAGYCRKYDEAGQLFLEILYSLVCAGAIKTQLLGYLLLCDEKVTPDNIRNSRQWASIYSEWQKLWYRQSIYRVLTEMVSPGSPGARITKMVLLLSQEKLSLPRDTARKLKRYGGLIANANILARIGAEARAVMLSRHQSHSAAINLAKNRKEIRNEIKATHPEFFELFDKRAEEERRWAHCRRYFGDFVTQLHEEGHEKNVIWDSLRVAVNQTQLDFWAEIPEAPEIVKKTAEKELVRRFRKKMPKCVDSEDFRFDRYRLVRFEDRRMWLNHEFINFILKTYHDHLEKCWSNEVLEAFLDDIDDHGLGWRHDGWLAFQNKKRKSIKEKRMWQFLTKVLPKYAKACREVSIPELEPKAKFYPSWLSGGATSTKEYELKFSSRHGSQINITLIIQPYQGLEKIISLKNSSKRSSIRLKGVVSSSLRMTNLRRIPKNALAVYGLGFTPTHVFDGGKFGTAVETRVQFQALSIASPDPQSKSRKDCFRSYLSSALMTKRPIARLTTKRPLFELPESKKALVLIANRQETFLHGTIWRRDTSLPLGFEHLLLNRSYRRTDLFFRSLLDGRRVEEVTQQLNPGDFINLQLSEDHFVSVEKVMMVGADGHCLRRTRSVRNSNSHNEALQLKSPSRAHHSRQSDQISFVSWDVRNLGRLLKWHTEFIKKETDGKPPKENEEFLRIATQRRAALCKVFLRAIAAEIRDLCQLNEIDLVFFTDCPSIRSMGQKIPLASFLTNRSQGAEGARGWEGYLPQALRKTGIQFRWVDGRFRNTLIQEFLTFYPDTTYLRQGIPCQFLTRKDSMKMKPKNRIRQGTITVGRNPNHIIDPNLFLADASTHPKKTVGVYSLYAIQAKAVLASNLFPEYFCHSQIRDDYLAVMKHLKKLRNNRQVGPRHPKISKKNREPAL